MSNVADRAIELRHLSNQAIEKAKAGELAQSMTICEQIIEADPSNGIGLRTRADADAIAGDKHEACTALKEAISLGIAPVADYCKLGYFLLEVKRPEEALQTAESALDIADNEEMAFLGQALRMIAAYAALKTGDAATARRHASRCAADAEDYFDGRMIGRDEILARANANP